MSESTMDRQRTVWERENERCPGIAPYSDLADRISWLVSKRHLGWLADADGTPHIPTTAHDEHIWDSGCAVCKVGDAPIAFRVVIDAVLDAAPRDETYLLAVLDIADELADGNYTAEHGAEALRLLVHEIDPLYCKNGHPPTSCSCDLGPGVR